MEVDTSRKIRNNIAGEAYNYLVYLYRKFISIITFELINSSFMCFLLIIIFLFSFISFLFFFNSFCLLFHFIFVLLSTLSLVSFLFLCISSPFFVTSLYRTPSSFLLLVHLLTYLVYICPLFESSPRYYML